MNKQRCLLVVVLVLILTISYTTFASDEFNNIRDGEVIFLLDTSGSMKKQNQDRSAVDVIRQAVYSVPSNYKTGIVAYNTNIQTIVPLDTDSAQMEAQLGSIIYNGYTNAGEGLNQALGLFSDKENIERSIVLLTDGEIDMPDYQAKEASRVQYAEAAARARDRGIKKYIVAIGSELTDPQMHIFDGAELTDGAIYWEGQSGTLTQIMNRILYDRLNFPKRSVGVADGNGGTLSIELPAAGARRVKIMLSSSQNLQSVTANYTAEYGQVINGQRFAVVDIGRPIGETVDINFQTPEGSAVEAYMTVDYEAEPVTEISYRRDEIPQTDQNGKALPPVYNHFADLRIGLRDINGKNDSLLNTTYYEGQEIPVRVNGTLIQGKINNGVITHSLPIDGISELSIEVNTVNLPERYEITQPLVTAFSPPPDPLPEPETDYRPLMAIIGLLALALLLLLGWWIKKKNTTVIYMAQPPASREPSKKMETRTCTYSGKLNMYVVRTADGRDVPPQTYRLFGRNSTRMTLDQILTSCKIKFGKIGADDIILYPGPDHSVIIMDQSERCTTLRGTEILKKGMGYPVYYGEKLTITFEDEATEIEIHYKSLKPSEREA